MSLPAMKQSTTVLYVYHIAWLWCTDVIVH